MRERELDVEMRTTLRQMQLQLARDFVKAARKDKVLEVFVKHADTPAEAEDGGLDSVCPFGETPVRDINGVVREGKWLRIKNGITMNSGSSVFVMPPGWLQMFALRESTGSRKGQTFVAAAKDGKPIANEGEKTIKFFTKPSLESERRKMTCQVAKVNKIRGSVAGTCDADCTVLFTKSGGQINNLKTGEVTPFRRHGNICDGRLHPEPRLRAGARAHGS